MLRNYGDKTVQRRLSEISGLMAGSGDASAGLAAFEAIARGRFAGHRLAMNAANLPELVASVNQQRLSNFPLALSAEDIEAAYRSLMDGPEASSHNAGA